MRCWAAIGDLQYDIRGHARKDKAPCACKLPPDLSLDMPLLVATVVAIGLQTDLKISGPEL